MKENQVSDTAIKTACWRAYHSRIDNPKIFNDFLAFAPPEIASSFSDDADTILLPAGANSEIGPEPKAGQRFECG